MFNLRITDEDDVVETALARDFSRKSPFHYGVTIAASALGTFGGLLMVAAGLVDITRPMLPMSGGLTLAGLGAVVFFGSLAVLQVFLRRLKNWKVGRGRIDDVVNASERRSDG